MITATPTFGSDIPDADAETPDPLVLLGMWLPKNTDELKPLMTLATAEPDGTPDIRNVLLSEFDGECVYFHTDARSRKVDTLAANPRVALALVWVEIGRQLTIQGVARRADTEQAQAAYAARSRYLQLLAWRNDDELAQQPASERRSDWAEFDAAHPEGSLTAPGHWLGFRVRPTRLTFWRGDPDGPSNRTEYRRMEDGSWAVRRLAG